MVSRRRTIALVGSTALLATAGCAGFGGDDDPEHRENAPPLVDFSIHVEGPDGDGTLLEAGDVESVGEVDEDDVGPLVPVRFTDEAVADAIETYEDVGGDETGEDVQLTVAIEGDVARYETYDISPGLATAITEGDWDGEFIIHTDSEGDAATLREGLRTDDPE